MPIAYQCFLCRSYFTYEKVRVHVEQPYNKTNVMTITVSCKQPTFCSIGQTGDDYVCGDCINRAIRKKGLD